nr:hypothetical protein [uncultured Cohaesibacter sp.]
MVRIGEPLPPKTNHGANILAKIWSTYISKVKSDWEIEKKEKLAKAKGLEEADSQKTSKEIKDKDWNLAKRTIKPNRREYGCLCGLWELWPDGQQAKIFKKVLKEWHIFCAGMFWQQSFDEVEGEQAEKRFFHYPSITVIRRYHMVALEMIEIETQDKGKNPLPWLKAKNPSLWKHLDKKGDQKGGSKPETPVEESVSGGSGDGDMSESS